MKIVFILIVTAVTLNSFNAMAQKRIMKNPGANTLQTDHRAEDSFGLAVFTALQNKDTAAWVALYPTNDEYRSILQAGLAAKAEGLTQQIIDDILVRRNKEAAGVYSNQFNHYCQQADSIGITWNDAGFKKIDFEPVYPKPVKLKYLSGTIHFTCKQKRFVIEGVQAIYIKSGIKLQALMGITELGVEE